MAGNIRWGILGPGSIANKFVQGVQFLTDSEVVAVGSRDLGRANEFAGKYGIPNRHGSYEALVADPDVDIVYVATPHPMHKDGCLLALNAGKPVLCEKPFTINAKEAEEVIRAARERKLFLMEAMWSRYFPAMAKVRELIESGAIGEVRMVQADFGFRGSYDPNGRLFDPELGGGALLDVGVYVISFSSMILGEPERVSGMATLCESGVDEQAVMTFAYKSGALTVLSTAVRTNSAHEARILGTNGRIAIHSHWWTPVRLTVTRDGKDDEEITLPFESTGFNYEAAEVARCLREGKLESDVMPLDETLSIMRTMDTLRAQWGIKYPME